jgi:putative transcriptional regulator
VTRTVRMPTDLAAARLRAGLTQEALAEAVGIGRVHLAKLETHRHSPNVSLALRLADALGEPVEELFAWARDFQ